MTTTPPDAAQATPPTLAEVAEIIVTALNLEMSPDEIEADAPLFGAVTWTLGNGLRVVLAESRRAPVLPRVRTA